MEAEYARLDATLGAGLQELRGDIARLEGELKARVSLDTQNETIKRIHDRIDSLERSILNLQRLVVGILVAVLSVLGAALAGGAPG